MTDTEPQAERCNPDTLCWCRFARGWSWPMHWRPDAAPEAPWTWLDARADAR